MFENIGRKIKILAKVFFWIGAVASFFGANYLFNTAADAYRGVQSTLVIAGFAVLIGGPLASWLVSLFIYGCGQMIDNTAVISSNMRLLRGPSAPFASLYETTPDDLGRCRQLQRLLKQGLITEDEYQHALSSGADL